MRIDALLVMHTDRCLIRGIIDWEMVSLCNIHFNLITRVDNDGIKFKRVIVGFHTRAKCAIWMIINSSYGSFEWRYFGLCVRKMTVQRCFPVTYLSNHAAKIAIWMLWPLNCDLGGGATWPSNHFRIYTARCTCTEAMETRAPCMFDWQGTQTRATLLLPLWNAKPQIWYTA